MLTKVDDAEFINCAVIMFEVDNAEFINCTVIMWKVDDAVFINVAICCVPECSCSVVKRVKCLLKPGCLL